MRCNSRKCPPGRVRERSFGAPNRLPRLPFWRPSTPRIILGQGQACASTARLVHIFRHRRIFARRLDFAESICFVRSASSMVTSASHKRSKEYHPRPNQRQRAWFRNQRNVRQRFDPNMSAGPVVLSIPCHASVAGGRKPPVKQVLGAGRNEVAQIVARETV